MTASIPVLEAELKAYLLQEYRQDPPFRYAIAQSQMGSIASHLTHDKNQNPEARPYGTPESEKSDFGHALLQLMLYGISRNLPMQESIDLAFSALRTHDWKVRKPLDKQIAHVAFPGAVTAPVFVDVYCRHLDEMPQGSILVAMHPNCSISQHIHKCAGIITDQGGFSSHVAVIAREFKVPCFVGAGGATEWLYTGDIVSMETVEGMPGHAGVIKRR